jgi:ParB-like chromosome segregation protein Spo0J
MTGLVGWCVAVMNARLKELIERVETGPKETQEEALEVLLAIEEGRVAMYELSDEDRAALVRSAEGRLVPDRQVVEFFERNRRS